MKIVQISDFHFEEYTEAAFLDAIVRKVNAVAPDLVVLSGDFVSSKPLPRHFSVGVGYQCADISAGSLARSVTLFWVTMTAWSVSHAVTDALRTHDIPVLANSFVPLERNGQRCGSPGSRMCSRRSPTSALHFRLAGPN